MWEETTRSERNMVNFGLSEVHTNRLGIHECDEAKNVPPYQRTSSPLCRVYFHCRRHHGARTMNSAAPPQGTPSARSPRCTHRRRGPLPPELRQQTEKQALTCEGKMPPLNENFNNENFNNEKLNH